MAWLTSFKPRKEGSDEGKYEGNVCLEGSTQSNKNSLDRGIKNEKLSEVKQNDRWRSRTRQRHR